MSSRPSSDGDYIVVDRAALMSLPTGGPAWDRMLGVANGDLGRIDLADQTNANAGHLVGAELVYARTGQPYCRERVVEYLRQLPDRVIVGRTGELCGPSARWLHHRRRPRRLSGSRLRRVDRSDSYGDFGVHGRWFAINQTSEVAAHNRGAQALACRAAVSAYLGDTADLARAAQVFRGFTGERAHYSGFRWTAYYDPSWACGPPDQWVATIRLLAGTAVAR